jgi:hypothetical protein
MERLKAQEVSGLGIVLHQLLQREFQYFYYRLCGTTTMTTMMTMKVNGAWSPYHSHPLEDGVLPPLYYPKFGMNHVPAVIFVPSSRFCPQDCP